MTFMETNNEDPKWILEPQLNCLEQESEIDHLNFLYQKGKFYVMDNHLAAGWCWLHTLDKQKKYGFIHIDQHDDFLNDINMGPFKNDLLVDEIELSVYTDLHTPERKVFRWDNYILQIQQILPKWFSHVCVSTHRTHRIPELEIHSCPSVIDLPLCMKSFISRTDLDYILNLDIDFFFNENGVRILTDDYIRILAMGIKHLLPNIAVVTIALSPECCERDNDGWENAIEAMSILDSKLSIGFIEEFKSKILL